MVDPRGDPIHLVESRHREWRRLFDVGRNRLRALFDRLDLRASVLRVEHVGSPAVPGLAAKDVVDVDIVVEDGAVAEISGAIAPGLGGTRHENSPTW